MSALLAHIPANLRALNICRLPDGTYQASLQTDDMPANAFRVRDGGTVVEAVTALLLKPLPPPPGPMP